MSREVKECPICGGEIYAAITTHLHKVVLSEDCEDITQGEETPSTQSTRIYCVNDHDQDAMFERQQLCTRIELYAQREMAQSVGAKDMVIHINAVLTGQIEPEEWLIDACQSSRAGTDTILPIQGE